MTAVREFHEETGCNFWKNVIVCDFNNPLIIEYIYPKSGGRLRHKWTTVFPAHCNNLTFPRIILPNEIRDIKWFNLKVDVRV